MDGLTHKTIAKFIVHSIDFLRQIVGLRKKYPNIYVACRIGTTPNTNQYQYQVKNDGWFLVIKVLMEKNPNYQNFCTQYCLKNK